jgi:hypothetical protein
MNFWLRDSPLVPVQPYEEGHEVLVGDSRLIEDTKQSPWVKAVQDVKRLT